MYSRPFCPLIVAVLLVGAAQVVRSAEAAQPAATAANPPISSISGQPAAAKVPDTPGGNPPAAENAAGRPGSILFLGNSYTYVNNLPWMIQALAAAGGRKIEVEMLAPGGCTLQRHATNSGAIERIRGRKWDIVVLQEQSQIPVMMPREMREAADKLHATIAAQGSRTLLFVTWARQAQPENQRPINQAYTDIAKELGAAMVPVGPAWRMALDENPKRVLHNPDGSHPNLAGAYLAACVFYGVLFHKSPEGLPGTLNVRGKPLVVAPALAKQLQSIAWKTVQTAR